MLTDYETLVEPLSGGVRHVWSKRVGDTLYGMTCLEREPGRLDLDLWAWKFEADVLALLAAVADEM